MTAQVFTIGFTEKRAEKFFSLLSRSGAKKLIDVRLNTRSQLAGFAKQADLPYFLNAICGIEYHHAVDLAPSQMMLDSYKKQKKIDWRAYESQFLDLLSTRRVEDRYSQSDLSGACLLCSEHLPHHCHRRLVAEYLQSRWKVDLEIVHLT